MGEPAEMTVVEIRLETTDGYEYADYKTQGERQYHFTCGMAFQAAVRELEAGF